MSRVLGGYQLLTEVARGGMGSVWMGRQVDPPRRFVAIKTILPHLASDPRFVAMFLDEARIMSLLEHPNVVRILDFGEHDGELFQAMEWVEGVSLKDVLVWAKESPDRLPRDVWLSLLAQACDGLAAAHELSDESGPLHVVHRDVSPHNLLIGRDGVVRVIDFGVAKARDRVAGDTTSASMKGKIRYMAPEQAQGQALDARADVWSIGVIAYQFVSGEFPFDGPTDVAVLTALLRAKGPPPVDADVPPAIRGLLERALGYEQSDRYASCRELAAALRAARTSPEDERRTEIGAVVEAIFAVPSQGRRERLASMIGDAKQRGVVPRASADLDDLPTEPAVEATGTGLGFTGAPLAKTARPRGRLYAAGGILLAAMAGIALVLVGGRSSDAGAGAGRSASASAARPQVEVAPPEPSASSAPASSASAVVASAAASAASPGARPAKGRSVTRGPTPPPAAPRPNLDKMMDGRQ